MENLTWKANLTTASTPTSPQIDCSDSADFSSFALGKVVINGGIVYVEIRVQSRPVPTERTPQEIERILREAEQSCPCDPDRIDELDLRCNGTDRKFELIQERVSLGIVAMLFALRLRLARKELRLNFWTSGFI